jgi:hypothetical protein
LQLTVLQGCDYLTLHIERCKPVITHRYGAPFWCAK